MSDRLIVGTADGSIAADVVHIVLTVLRGSIGSIGSSSWTRSSSGTASSGTIADDGHASLDYILIRHKHREASTERARVSKSRVALCVCVEI